VLNTTHRAVGGWATDRQSDTRHIASRSDVRAEVRELLALPRHREQISESRSLNRLRTIIEAYLIEEGDLGFFVISPDGVNVASMRNGNLGEHNLLLDAGRDLLAPVFSGGSRVILPLRSEIPLPDARGALASDQATMFAAAPIFDDDGSVMAALLIRIDPSGRFTGITQMARTGETGDTYVFNRDGVLLTETRFDAQLRVIGLLRQDQRSILQLTLRDPGGNMLEGFRPEVPRETLPLSKMARDATAGRDGVDTIGYRDYRGVPVVGAWLWDEKLGLGMTAEIDVAEAYETYYAIRRTIAIVISVISALFVGYSVNLIARARHRETANRLLVREIREREEIQRDKERLIGELREALGNVKTLRGLLPICSACKKIRDDRGIWKRIEAYIHEHSEAELSHGICPDCLKKFHPDVWEEMRSEGAFEVEGSAPPSQSTPAKK
jgi:hypothetical protein